MSTPSDPRPLVRPSFPHLQSTTSTNTSSYSSTTSLATPSPHSAPLPSPSQTHPQHQGFFGSLNQQQMPQSPQMPQQQTTKQQQSPFNYQPNRDGAGRTAHETNQFLSQTALLAEAAKRAQMAVVMRDIEGMEL